MAGQYYQPTIHPTNKLRLLHLQSLFQYTRAQVILAKDGAEFDLVGTGEEVVGDAEDDFG